MNGITIFGKDCFKLPEIPEIFDNDRLEPLYSPSQQETLSNMINKTFIDF